jgi:hypothetical protein
MESPFTAILLSRDAQTLCTMEKAFDEFSIDADLCLSAPTATRLLEERQFDLLVLDFDSPGAMAIMDFHGRDTEKHPSAVIAITRGPSALKQALTKRVYFEVQKPFTADLMAKTLKASYSLIVKEKRARFRHAVTVVASASFIDNGVKRLLPGSLLTDISETGMCIKVASALPVQATVFVDFKLPETNNQVHATCNVTWSDADGHTGVRYQFVPPLEQRDLQRWLDARCPWDAELVPRALQSRSNEPAAAPLPR